MNHQVTNGATGFGTAQVVELDLHAKQLPSVGAPAVAEVDPNNPTRTAAAPRLLDPPAVGLTIHVSRIAWPFSRRPEPVPRTAARQVLLALRVGVLR